MDDLLELLDNLDGAIKYGNLGIVEKYIDDLKNDFLHDQNLFDELSKGKRRLLKYDLINKACEHKQAAILYYLLNDTDILKHLPPTDDDGSFDIDQEDEQRSKTFNYAIYSGNIEIVALLYNYWRGDMHWSANNDTKAEKIKEITRLGSILQDVYNSCQEYLDEHQNMKTGVHCYIKFNDFQHTVWTKLCNIPPPAIDSDAAADADRAKEVIRQVLGVYKNFSEIEHIRLEKETTEEDEQDIKLKLEEKDTFYYKWFIYTLYNEYFIELDFSVSLLVLDNLNIIKRYYDKVPADVYHDIEYRIYHFIYCVSENWRLYVHPDSTIMKKEYEGLRDGHIIGVKVKYNENKINNAAVLFLERRELKQCLENVITYIEVGNSNHICKDPNYLKLMDYMRDYYSLKKMVYYMEAVESDDELNVLCIERALTVMGEMMKSTSESYNLSVTTKALLQIETSVEIVKLLHIIRGYIVRKNHGELCNRIEIAKNKDIFRKIKTDIKIFIQRINSIVNIYQLLLDKSLLQNGVDLINARIEDWAIEDKQIDFIYDSYTKEGTKFIDNFIETVWSKNGLQEGLLKEIIFTRQNKEEIILKIHQVEANITHVAAIKLPQYILIIRHELKRIKENNQMWESVRKELLKHKTLKNKVKPYAEGPPPLQILNLLKDKVQSIDKILFNDVKPIEDLSDHWISINRVIEFFLDEISIFKIGTGAKQQLKHSIFNNSNTPNGTGAYGMACSNNLPNKPTERIDVLITSMEEDVRLHLTQPFAGIEEMYDKMNSYPKTNTNNIKDIRDKLMSNLIQRVNILRDTLGYPNKLPLSQQRLKYMHDQKFRSVVEMLLIDICNIFVQCKIRKLMNKSGNLLAGVDIRNVLVHGNQILEIIGDVLDPCDFSTELLSKAMMVAKDSESIEALYKLFKGNIKSVTIEDNDQSSMDEDQKKYLAQFRNCDRWRMYLKLIPKSGNRTYSLQGSPSNQQALNKQPGQQTAVQAK